MKAVKVIVILALLYIATVALFELLLGVFQPTNEQTLVITTYDESGASHARVLRRLASGGAMYVAANHWPRTWYREAKKNPQVEIDINGDKSPYLAVPVSAAEHDRVADENGLSLGFRLLTGFPPRYFLRLDPR